MRAHHLTPALVLTMASLALGAAEPPLLPWQTWVEKPTPERTRDLESVLGLPWRNSGGKEGRLSVSSEPGPRGGKTLEFRVKIDHFNEGKYPQGWPSFETVPTPTLDFSGFDAIRYRIRCDTELDRAVRIRFILWTGGTCRLNVEVPPFPPGKWVDVTHRIRQLPDVDRIERVHFFLCENEYQHGDELTFRVGGLQLCDLRKEVSQLEPSAAAMGLWVGKRADTSDRIVVLDQPTATLPALLVFETGSECELRASDKLHATLHEVFSGARESQELPLGKEVGPGRVSRVEKQFDVSRLRPGYYLVTTDVRRGTESLLGGRVGSDDLYVRRPGESMTDTVLSVRTGMVQWVRDLLHGDVMCRTKIALPHVYDPLCEETYPDFIRLFAHTTGKHTEGNEAGDTGLALAAEAFRKSGDMERCRFVERLLKDSYKHMLEKMQAPSGGTISWANELADRGIGKGGPTAAFGSYDSNQIGEWMRAITYGILYFRGVPGEEAYARFLSAGCRRAADFLVAHSVQESDGIPRVLRHLRLNEAKDGTVKQVTYHQEKRQCDVYLGRALAGLSYYAYAMELLGERVPEAWWAVMDDTVRWSAAKMKPNGWFDWQCEDVVEGGCHTFLGNIYIGEGLFGCYLANRLGGRTDAAGAAHRATHKAYRYVTDDCWIRGKKFEYPLEFWVGPYVYWLFTEYIDTAGPEPVFQEWLDTLDRRWSVERRWTDFLDRASTGGCGRTTTNGMLEVSILGYLGIKRMAETGKPLHWDVGD